MTTKQQRKTKARKDRQQKAWEAFKTDMARQGKSAGYFSELDRITFHGISLNSKHRIVTKYGPKLR